MMWLFQNDKLYSFFFHPNPSEPKIFFQNIVKKQHKNLRMHKTIWTGETPEVQKLIISGALYTFNYVLN